jgi:hypothetical protein
VEQLEVVIFDEVDDYKEKIKGLTFRQWIFCAIALIIVIPTYIFVPKFLGISQDITSYIVMVEAAIIGFFGFIKIHNLDAEQIVPYWYRHYVIYNKPIKYVTDKQWTEEHTKNKDKKKAQKSKNNIYDELEVQKKENAVVEQQTTSKPTKKELKAQKKQQKMLEKAKKKYGNTFDITDNEEIQENITEDKKTSDDKENIIQEDVVLNTPDVKCDEVSNETKINQHQTNKTDVENTEDKALHMLMGMLTPEQIQQLSKMANQNDNNTQ